MGCPIKGSCNAFDSCSAGNEKYMLARIFCNTSDKWQGCPAYRPVSSVSVSMANVSMNSPIASIVKAAIC